jgi:hypothetical protein
MTQQDKDRDVFEKWALDEGSYDLSTDQDGDYIKPDTWELHRGWRAAREHNAPKLTEKEAVEIAAISIQKRYWEGDLAISVGDAKKVCTELAKAVLRAVGVQFK